VGAVIDVAAPASVDTRTRVGTRGRTWRLLIACARHAAGLTDASEVGDVAATINDWAHVERRTSAHGLVPWLARALAQGAPSDEHAPIIAAANASAGRTLAQVRRLGELVGALADVGVTALPYKGPVLSLQLYGDLALRQSVDLDLVVPFDTYDVARAALVRRGLPPRWGHSARQECTLFAWLGHAPFGEGDDFVELHWRFADRRFPFALDARDAVRRAREPGHEPVRRRATFDVCPFIDCSRHIADFARVGQAGRMSRAGDQQPPCAPACARARTDGSRSDVVDHRAHRSSSRDA